MVCMLRSVLQRIYNDGLLREVIGEVVVCQGRVC